MWDGAIKIDTVSLLEKDHLVTDGSLESSLDDHPTFFAFMAVRPAHPSSHWITKVDEFNLMLEVGAQHLLHHSPGGDELFPVFFADNKDSVRIHGFCSQR